MTHRKDRYQPRAASASQPKMWAIRLPTSKPELVRQAKRLRRRSPKGNPRSLRDVATELAKLGFLNERGAEFSASSIASIIAN